MGTGPIPGDRNQTMPPAVCTRSYDVNTMVVNPQKRLGLIGLLNILQDIAWIHGSDLGHGYEAMMAKGWIWGLTRQQLIMSDWPPGATRLTFVPGSGRSTGCWCYVTTRSWPDSGRSGNARPAGSPST